MQLLMVEVKMKTQSVCIDASRGLVEELSVWWFPSPMAAARVLPWAIWQARHPALAQTIRAPPARQRHGCYREEKCAEDENTVGGHGCWSCRSGLRVCDAAVVNTNIETKLRNCCHVLCDW